MRIDNIKLFNFGSYEGLAEFDTKVHDNRNIVLIGGKNGAGKTTLFTAMRICLYGFMSMGYKNANSFYNRAIIKLINNNAKLNKPANAYVDMMLSLSSGQDIDSYEIKREWVLADGLTENFTVKKNQVPLSTEEVADFEKYLLSLIPPELFNLYFFDGEEIADYFMNDGSNTRIKNAFLTLCGYDIFDIMRKNFKRISSENKATSSLEDYIKAKDNFNIAKNEVTVSEIALDSCRNDLDSCESDIVSLDNNYSKSGGITQEEWSNKITTIKEEERKRENWNALLKHWANEKIPFIMIRKQIEDAKKQIINESNCSKFRNFCEVIDSKNIALALKDANVAVDIIKSLAKEEYGNDEEAILDLSFEQSTLVLSQINEILEFDDKKISKCKTQIKKSIGITTKLRKELDNSDISSAQEYMEKRAELFERKSNLLNQSVSLEHEINDKREKFAIAEAEFNKAQKVLEEELKQTSINDIAAKSIVMLDKLQLILFHKQIEKVEDFFRKEISILIRKTNFIDDIYIDDDFNIHIYRNDVIETSKLLEIAKLNNESQLISLLGMKAINQIIKTGQNSDVFQAISSLEDKQIKSIELPVEIDKTSLSKGEKQILIMAIYHSLVQLCSNEIPFIIDTPFARIDTEHRQNISRNFFSKLNGQVFILSTNEEIVSEHVQIMKEKILATYMLENTDNKKTIVSKNVYFEGA